MEPVPESVSAVHNATNATRDVESEFEAGQEGKIREIVMDNVDSEPMVKLVFSFLFFSVIVGWTLLLRNQPSYCWQAKYTSDSLKNGDNHKFISTVKIFELYMVFLF